MITPPSNNQTFQGPTVPAADEVRKLSILIVEDEPSICRALSIALTRKGYDPVIATSGESALYQLRTRYFDLMLADLRMPDMRGDVVFHLATSLQGQLRNQTLFITGDVTEQAHDLIEACGCPLLMKPFDLHDLTKAVSVMMSRRQKVGIQPEELESQQPETIRQQAQGS
jgi:DNA-binding response OmpR family regulator